MSESTMGICAKNMKDACCVLILWSEATERIRNAWSESSPQRCLDHIGRAASAAASIILSIEMPRSRPYDLDGAHYLVSERDERIAD